MHKSSATWPTSKLFSGFDGHLFMSNCKHEAWSGGHDEIVSAETAQNVDMTSALAQHHPVPVSEIPHLASMQTCRTDTLLGKGSLNNILGYTTRGMFP